MPKVAKNVNRRKLTHDEILEFEQVGYSPEEIEKLGVILQEPHWDFWCRASELYLSLAAGSAVLMRSGKLQSEDTVTSIKFSKNYAQTANRDVARLIFMSDPYRDGSIKLSKDQVIAEADKKYKEFKTAVFSSQANIERLKQDLAAAG